MSGSIYTRRGDSGETSLVGGARISKTSARIEAIGTLDEANSAIGLARAALSAGGHDGRDIDLDSMLDSVQHSLFTVAGALATPPAPSTAADTPAGVAAELPSSASVTPDDVATLESWIDALSAQTGALTRFVLPGGAESAARLHVARTITRRAERRILDVHEHEPVDDVVLAFINRVSDLLFAAARYENRAHGDVIWNPEK